MPTRGLRDAAPPRLLDAIRPSVLRALTAERADAYVSILGEMLALRRAGDVAPTLAALRRRVSTSAEDETPFLRDLLQLEEWGCLARELEPLRIRGHRDASRDRFRHRLSEDAVALLEWLETRLQARERAPSLDARDRFRDVLDRARELRRIAEQEPSVESARRVVHLMRATDSEIGAIESGLVELHAQMRRFAQQSFDPRALDRVVAGLEDFVASYVIDLRAQRAELVTELAAIEAASERLERLGATGAPHPLAMGAAPPVAERLSAWRGFLEDGGRLDLSCHQIETATREVVAKLREHVAMLERRGDRAHDLARVIERLLSLPSERDIGLGLWGNGTPTWAPGEGERLAPPLPRRKRRAPLPEPALLPEKRVSREVARDVRADRIQDDARWLRTCGLAQGDRPARLSETRSEALRAGDAPTMWMRIMRARHLRGGIGLVALGVRIERADGAATLGNAQSGLTSEDCIVTSIAEEPVS